jgi:hypothetical protein
MMKKTVENILFTSIPVIAILLIIGAGYRANNDTQSLTHDSIDVSVGDENESGIFSEVIIPMSCLYRGRLQLDSGSQSSLKRFQRNPSASRLNQKIPGSLNKPSY